MISLEVSNSNRSRSRLTAAILALILVIAVAYASFYLFRPSSQPVQITSKGYTLSDETTSLGSDVWESEFYFPALGRGFIVDLINGSTSCPCKVQSESLLGDTFKVVASDDITLESTPSNGSQVIEIGPNFQPNNFMPNVQPGDVFEHWTNASVIRISNFVEDPFFQTPNSVFVDYGKVILQRGGSAYVGFGTYQHVTARAISDAHPIPGFTAEFGWIGTPKYFLLAVESQYQGQNGDQSEVALTNGSVSSVSVSISDMSCSGLTYSFILPSSGQNITINYTIQWHVGTCAGGGEQAGPFTDSLGQSGYGWSLLFS